MDAGLLEYLSNFVSPQRLARMDEVLAHRTRRVCVVLENVLQAHNASAIMRSADCFGVQDIHLITNDGKFKPKKGITRGSHKWLSVTRHNERGIDNTKPCFEKLRAAGYRIACLHPHAEARNLSELDLGTHKYALVIGSEGEGLSEYALQNGDLAIKYPMYGYSESLNLSVLGALCMNEVRRALQGLPRELWQLSDEDRLALRAEWVRKSVREHRHLEARYASEGKRQA